MFERGGQAVDLEVVGRSYRLTLFGNFSLCIADGRAVTGLSRKSKGLIAYLALSPRNAGRDSLAELLWDGRGVEQARASLRQACYELRHCLPARPPLLIFDRDEIRLVRENVASDIDDLEASAAGLLGALVPSHGELLRDLNGLSPAFDDWLRVERSRVGEERRAMALDAARDALFGHRWSDAKGIASSLIALDPTDEDAVEIALRALGECGNLQEAQALYSRHTNALRHELEVAPAATNAALFAGLTEARRTRHRAPAIPSAARHTLQKLWQTPSATGAAATGNVRSTAPTRRYGATAAFAGVLVAALLVGGARFRHVPAAAALPLVEVEPLAVPAGDEQAQAISAGLRSSLVQKLAGTETPAQVVDAGAKSNGTPALIVRGNSLTDHGRLRANIELVAGSSGQVLWATAVDRSASELDSFEEQLSLQIAHELHCAYSDGRAPYFARDLEFARLSLSHCETIGHDIDESLRFDAEITRRAPGFARGWAEYAMDTALATSDLPPALQPANARRADTLAHHAIALDPKQGLAYAALVDNLGPSSWSERQQIETNGLMADPRSPELHFRVADNMASIGRLDDSLREAQSAYQFDHFLPGKVLLLAASDILVGDTDDASDALANGRKYWPGHPWFDYLALRLGIAGSRPADALKLLTTHAIRVDPTRAHVLEAFLRWRIAPTGYNNAAAAAAMESAARGNGATGEEVRLLAALNRVDAAYRVAEHLQPNAAGDSSEWFGPDLARLRSDPRFMALAARLGVAQVWWHTGLWPDFCMQAGISTCRTQVAAVLGDKGTRLTAGAAPGRPRLLLTSLRASRARVRPDRARLAAR
jgi:DNA-binding SARP family transcriptional activator/TolB-like protein